MIEHPGVVFKDGPSGRRAAIAFGPDVWEIVKVLRELDERGSNAIAGAAGHFPGLGETPAHSSTRWMYGWLFPTRPTDRRRTGSASCETALRHRIDVDAPATVKP